MSVKIRKYEANDKEALVICIRELQHHISLLDELKRARSSDGFNVKAYVNRFLAIIRKHQGIIFVADDNGKIIGCIVGIISETSKDDELEVFPSRDGKILELYVTEGHRGQRIGAALMQEMEQYFRDLGCAGCHVDCFAPNVDAHKFYHSLGYIDRTIYLLKLLGSPTRSMKVARVAKRPRP